MISGLLAYHYLCEPQCLHTTPAGVRLRVDLQSLHGSHSSSGNEVPKCVLCFNMGVLIYLVRVDLGYDA